MALAGFSIREYAANMRSVDFDKCWPFHCREGAAAAKSLPQISIRKFRIWSEEITSIPNPEEGKDEEIPSAVRTMLSKRKQRTPKKRSIVELFAVAPQIETAEEEDGDDFKSAEQKDEEIKGKEIMEEGEKKGKKINKRSKKKRKLMTKKKKKKLKVEICAAKKEKINKPSSAHIFETLQGPMHQLLSGKNSKSSVRNAKKPAYIENLPKNHKLKLLQSSKPISKEQKEPGKVLRVHSILKNPTGGNKKRAGTKTNKQDHLINFCCESEKGTTISGNDDILGQTKSCSPIDIPQLRSLYKIFSDVLAASSALEDKCKGDDVPAASDVAQAENVNDTNVAENIVERKSGTSSENQLLSECHSDIPPPMCTYPSNESFSDAERASYSITADEHHYQIIPGTSTLLVSDKHLDDPRILDCVHSEGCSSRSDIQETCPKTSNTQSLVTPVKRCASRSDAAGSLSFIRNPSPLHSISCPGMNMEENRRQTQQPVDPLTDSCWQINEFHAMHHLPSKGLVENLHSSVGSRLVQHPVPTSKDNCTGEGFVGLPLNSQGELIHLNSGANFGFNEISKRQNVIKGSIHSYPIPNYVHPRTSVDHVKIMKGEFPGATLNQKDRSSWFQEQYFHVGKPAISGSGCTNLQGFERCGVQRNDALSDKIFFHDCNLREVSCHGFREDNRTRNYIDRVNFQAEGNLDSVPQPNVQQTMRLMGTNVSVSSNNEGCQSYDDGRIWTDKEVVTGNCASAGASDRQLPNHWLQQQWIPHQSNGMTKNNFFRPVDASSNPYHMPAIAPRLAPTQFDYRSQWVSKNRTSSSTGNHCLKVNFFSHPLNSQSLLNETSKSIVNSIPGLTSVKIGHQVPTFASNPPKAYQNTVLNSIHCKHSQGIAYSTTSTFRPPFLYQETKNSFQSSPTNNSPNLPQWMLNAKQQKNSQEPSCSCYSIPVASHQHRNIARADLFPVPSSHPTSTILFPVLAATTSQRGGLSTPSLVQSSFIPPWTTSKSGTAVDNPSRSQNMNRGGTNYNFTYLKCLDSARKTRKRPAVKDDGFMKPAKKPFVKMQEETSALAGPGQGERMHVYIPYDKKTTDANNPEIISEKEGLSMLSGSCSSKVDVGSRSGPVKMSAGAKHILEPSQDTDQVNSSPTHSTLPFLIGNTSGKVLDPQMKAAEIYRF